MILVVESGCIVCLDLMLIEDDLHAELLRQTDRQTDKSLFCWVFVVPCIAKYSEKALSFCEKYIQLKHYHARW